MCVLVLQSEDKEKRRSLTKNLPKPASPKSEQNEGAWVCKLDGCNNTYAREADLKRHQRTSRAHPQSGSKPVYAYTLFFCVDRPFD